MKDIGYLDKGMWFGLGFYIATTAAPGLPAMLRTAFEWVAGL